MYDVYGNEIGLDITDDSEEAVGGWNTTARLSVQYGLAIFIDVDGKQVAEPSFDPGGRILWRIIQQERPRSIFEKTLGETMPEAPRDPADEALAALPATASKRTKAKALLKIGMLSRDIVIRLRSSESTVTFARAEIFREYDEAIARGEQPAPLHPHIMNPRGAALRGVPRPDMTLESGTHPMQRRARDLGVSDAEAYELAQAARNATKFKERPEDEINRKPGGRT